MLDPHDLTQSNVIYGLHAGDDVIRYVGLTTVRAKDRLNSHRKSARSARDETYRARWIRSMGVENICMVILEVVPPEISIYERERFWIKAFRELGNALTNATDGGEGAPGRIPSADEIERIKAKLSGSNCYAAKITEDQVRYVWKLLADGGTVASISRQLGLSHSIVASIHRGKTWKSLRPENWQEISRNSAARSRKIKALKGERHHKAKLKSKDIPIVWQMLREGISQAQIGKHFGVEQVTISRIMLGKGWIEQRPDDWESVRDASKANHRYQNSKLSAIQWLEVNSMKLSGMGNQSIANHFGVSYHVIYKHFWNA